MGWTNASLGRMFAALALLIAVFVATPAIDQITCTSEQPAAHALADDIAGGADHADPLSDHGGVCAHGHCHHNVSFRGESFADFPTVLAVRSDQQFPIEDARASFTPDGLKRPPRA